MFIRRDAIVEAFRLGVDEKPEWFLNLLETNRDLVYEVSGEEFKTYVSIRVAGAGPRRIATEGDWIVYSLGSLQIYKNDKFEELFRSVLRSCRLCDPTAAGENGLSSSGTSTSPGDTSECSQRSSDGECSGPQGSQNADDGALAH